MSMAPFHSVLPDLAFKEIRTVSLQGMPGLPDGEYGFLESYCTDGACDCRRVLINVISPSMPSQILATINYGWESIAFYTKWMRDPRDAAAAQGPTLDPLNTQTVYSPILLRLFETVLQDPVYVQRLRRHYTLFKQALRDKQRSKDRRNTTKKRRRR
jgi:hypothetical protein